jgi:hypothetical protein
MTTDSLASLLKDLSGQFCATELFIHSEMRSRQPLRRQILGNSKLAPAPLPRLMANEADLVLHIEDIYTLWPRISSRTSVLSPFYLICVL